MKISKHILVGIIPLFVTLIIFQSCTNKPKLKETGIKTSAIVVNGTSTKKKGRNFSTYTVYELELSFKTENGKKITIDKSVSQQEFNKVYVNCEIPIIYLPEDPTKLDVILTDEDVMFYYGIENRPLLLQDLYTLYNEENQDSVTNYLNSISYKWSNNIEQTTNYWENENKKELLAMNSGVLTYVTYNYMWHEKFVSNMENDGYVKTQKDSTGTEIFENEYYKIASSRKFDKNDQSIGISMYFVINMVKTDQD